MFAKTDSMTIPTMAAHTGQRLGQFLSNALSAAHNCHNDEQLGRLLFYITDEDLLQACRAYAKNPSMKRT